MLKRQHGINRFLVLFVFLFSFIVVVYNFINKSDSVFAEQNTVSFSLSKDDGTKLTNLAGGTVCGNMGKGGSGDSYNISTVKYSKPSYDYEAGEYVFTFDPNGYTVYKPFIFKTPLKLSEITSLTFDVYADLYIEGDFGYCFYGMHGDKFLWSTKGIILLGIENDGSDAVVLDPFFPVKSWQKWTITGDDLVKLANNDGMIKGFRVAAAVDISKWTNETKMTMRIGEVRAETETSGHNVTFVEGETSYSESAEGNIVLGEGTVNNGEIFVGWTTDVKNIESLYFTGTVYNVNSDVTFYAVTIDFCMTDGAYLRVVSEDSSINGIRFQANISSSDYSLIERFVVSKGIMISPAAYWTEREFVLQNNSADTPVLVASVEKDDWAKTGENNIFYGSIINIYENNFSLRFAARGFITLKSGDIEKTFYTAYSDEKNARSLNELAESYRNQLADASGNNFAEQ